MWNVKVTITGSKIGEGIRLKGCQRFVDVKQDVNKTKWKKNVKGVTAWMCM